MMTKELLCAKITKVLHQAVWGRWHDVRSAIVITEEIDDIEIAVDELVSCAMEKIGELGRSTIALVCCDAETDTSALGAALHDRLGCDVVGMTTNAIFERDFGYCGCGIVLCVLTDDSAAFSAASTGDLDSSNFEQEVAHAYDAARAALPSDPKLILCCAPFIPQILPDRYISALDERSGGTPIFGGISCGFFSLDSQRTFLNGESSSSRFVFALVAGDIAPIFAVKHDLDEGIQKKGRITKATDNRIFEVDGVSFEDYASKYITMPDDIDGQTITFMRLTTPFVLEPKDAEPGDVEIVRPLFMLDSTDGSGVFTTKMPEGSMISIHSMIRKNVAASCAKTIDQLLDRAAEECRTFSTIIGCTCNARAAIMGASKELEARTMADKLHDRDDVEWGGFYSFGEFAPIVSSNGSLKNRFHNSSFTLCAF